MADTVSIKIYDDLAKKLNRVEVERYELKKENERLKREREWLIGRMSLYSDINKEDIEKLLISYIQ